MKKSILNLKIKIIPDFDLNSFEGVIVLANWTNMEELIIRTLVPFYHENVNYEYLHTSPRHEDIFFDKILQKDNILCSFMRIPPEQVKSKNPFDISWWRGGGTFIGDIKYPSNE